MCACVRVSRAACAPQAVELLNWGLENRAMGVTAMNTTSSRSHTVLTINVRVARPPLGFAGRAAAPTTDPHAITPPAA